MADEREAGGAGEHVGPYELGAEIGRGAHGVVYEGYDRKLDRRVALKRLSAEGASDPVRRARFEREARVLAAIRHPNVAVVYGAQEADGVPWLALERLEGDALDDHLAQGALSIGDALDVARQVAAGLEAAHEAGVVHRDLKPSNVFRESDGTVKVLDFGLATSATVPTDVRTTGDGIAVGTPLYMSPEQLRGGDVDRRADLWSFGCLLCELLGGRPPFHAESGAELVGGILERDPDLDALPKRTPRRVRELVERCLQKDPRRRWRDAGDARIELETALEEREWVRGAEEHDAAGAGPKSRWLALIGLAVALVAGWWGGRAGESPGTSGTDRVLRLSLKLEAGDLAHFPLLSPSGDRIVHQEPGRWNTDRGLVSTRLDAFESVPLPGTRRARAFGYSPSGDRLGVAREIEGTAGRYELVVVPLDGEGPTRFITRLPDTVEFDGWVVWLDERRVALTGRPGELVVVTVEEPVSIERTPVVRDAAEWPNSPELLDALPGGEVVLARGFRQTARTAHEAIVSIDVATGEQRLLIDDSSCAQWVDSGRLLFSRAGSLFSASFDVDELRVGEPLLVANGLWKQHRWRSGDFHASRDRTAIWFSGDGAEEKRGLHLLDGVDSLERLPLDAEIEGFMTLSPNDEFITFSVSGAGGHFESWGGPVDGSATRMLLSQPGFDMVGSVAESPSGALYYCRRGEGRSEVRRTTVERPTEGELLYAIDRTGAHLRLPSLSDDGRTLFLQERLVDETRLIALDLDASPPIAPRLLFAVDRTWSRVRLSPDGQWVLATPPGGLPTVRRVNDDGTTGEPLTVPLSEEGGLCGLGRTADDGSPTVLVWPPGSFEVLVSAYVEDEDGPRLEPPVLLARPDGRRFWDAAHLGGARFLAELVDADYFGPDRLMLQIGALDGSLPPSPKPQTGPPPKR